VNDWRPRPYPKELESFADHPLGSWQQDRWNRAYSNWYYDVIDAIGTDVESWNDPPGGSVPSIKRRR